MSVIRLNNKICLKLGNCRYLSNSLRQDEDYTATPNYPPVLDLSIKKKIERKKDTLYEEIKNVKTVEEKQIKLNMPKYYGFKTFMFLENKCGYNQLPLTQYATRTHLVVNNNLPEYYKNINVDDLVAKIKPNIEECLGIEMDGYKRLHDFKNEDLTKGNIEDIISNSLSNQINRIITYELLSASSYLKEVQVDLEPKIESTWFVGGIDPPSNVVKSKEGQVWMKDRVNEPWDRLMVYKGCPTLALRSKLPLKPILSEMENSDVDVPVFNFDPRTVGISTEYRHITNIPGFWPGDSYKFGTLSYHKRGYILDRKYINIPDDEKKAIYRQGILTSFGWLLAQANNLGFTTFNDLTYPLVTQTIITNGKKWSFFTYQLNTILFCERFITKNPKRNICWATEEMNLFEEINNGKVIGFNEEVLKNVLKFYMNQPESRLGINFTPFLSNEEKICADYEDVDKRTWLEENYKCLMSNRPRHKLGYEIYAWEKIYKIDNKTRFMDKKLRPFELFQHPYQRKLNERIPKYIPKKFREDVKKVRGGEHKFAKDYFP